MRSPVILAWISFVAVPPCAAAAGTWTEVEPLPFGRSDASATTVLDVIYVAGGCDGSQDCSGGYCTCTSLTVDVSVYNPATDTWDSSLPRLPRPRYRHNACSWRDSIFLIGGRNLTADSIVPQIDVYNTTARTWSTLPSAYPADVGSDNTCVTLGDVIYVMGGYPQYYDDSFRTTYALHPVTGAWTRLGGRLATGRGDFTGVELGGLVYVYGGYSYPDFCVPLRSTEVYSPANDSWSRGPDLPDNLAEKGDGVVLGGAIYTMGGEKKAVTSGCVDTDITPLREVFSLTVGAVAWKNETWLPDARMRFGATSALGRIFVFGGQSKPIDGGFEIPLLSTVYAYDPAGIAPSPTPAPCSTNSAPSYSAGAIGGAIVATAVGTSLIWLLVLLICRRRCCGARASGGGAAPKAEPDAGADRAPLRQLASEPAPRVSTNDIVVMP